MKSVRREVAPWRSPATTGARPPTQRRVVGRVLRRAVVPATRRARGRPAWRSSPAGRRSPSARRGRGRRTTRRPARWPKRPSIAGSAEYARSSSALSDVHGMSSTTTIWLKNGSAANVCALLIGPAGMSARMPPPLVRPTWGASTPTAGASCRAFHRNESAHEAAVARLAPADRVVVTVAVRRSVTSVVPFGWLARPAENACHRVDRVRLDERVLLGVVRVGRRARDPHGAALGVVVGGDLARLVEVDGEAADVLVLAGRGDDEHGLARRRRSTGVGYAPTATSPGTSVSPGVGEQVVAAARDPDVDAAHERDQRLVGGDALEVGGDDDLVHAAGLQRRDLAVDDRREVALDRARCPARRSTRCRAS